ncbi:MAG: 2-oxoacid:acceptor oxidoreductase family protein [Acidobacteriota bacterium]
MITTATARPPAAGRQAPKYPGVRTATDGSGAIVEMETAASEGAGAYPITPSTQMGEGWAQAVAAGTLNVHGRSLLFFEPEGEHAAAAVTAGMSMTGLRATNFSSGQGIVYMHESLYAAVGKRLTYVLNIAARAITKHALNVHAGHDDYHAVDDTGFFQLFAKNVQEAADLNLVAHRIAELSLNPGILAQDGFLTSHVIETMAMPERELVREYLGDPADLIESPTPAQRWVFGRQRRRVPELFNLDYPAMLGVVQNQDSYAQGVAAQRPFYFDHLPELADRAMAEYAALTGRMYARAAGYRLEDAEWVLVGQGSVVPNCEAVVDHLRATRKLRVGVLNVTMFRPFPADLITAMLAGKRGVTVLERTDQPLAVDLPLLREIRAAMYKALENGRTPASPPYPGLAACRPQQMPAFFSGCFGLGSRDLQPADLVAAVDNMLEGGARRRQFYLGIDFVRPETRFPKLQIWQEDLLESYPQLGELSLRPAAPVNLLPPGAISIRIHSVGGWGAITTGKNLAQTAADLCGLHIQANPKYGSEKKGQPTTFYATLAREPIRVNAELKFVSVVLSPDPNVFKHSDPLAGLQDGGVFIMQGDRPVAEVWRSLPPWARKRIIDHRYTFCLIDGFKIASDEASDPELRYRMQGAAFMGAFFRASPLAKAEKLDERTIFDGIRRQLQKKFGHLGEKVVEDNVRVIRRGYDELVEVDAATLTLDGDAYVGTVPQMPATLGGTDVAHGIGHGGRFWEQVCVLCKMGEDGIADPYAAISAMPAATSTIRDMTNVRFEVPEFIPDKCTGCSQCWVQCPDAAIPGVVSDVVEVLEAAVRSSENGRRRDRVRQILKPLAAEVRRTLKGVPFTTFGQVVSGAYDTVVGKLGMDPERRHALDAEFAPVYSALAEFPLAKTAPFFDVPESKEKGTGGLLSITVNPDACKGCNICVRVCPDGALTTVKQTDEVVEKLRRNWHLWQFLPETHDRYVNVASVDEGIGVLSSLLLKQRNYRSMVGGDGACMGCGEKTVMHLVVSAINATMLPRVKRYVERLDTLIAELDRKARGLLASDASLASVGKTHRPSAGRVDIPLAPAKQAEVDRLARLLEELKDLRWRYVEGPSGKGRATTGIANATGCSSVWGSTYPYNPYPFPWVNHLFQDAPSIAIGLFEGHMRKMAIGFSAVRRAELELEGRYDPAEHDGFFGRFDWHQFTDEEFAMCPPILAVGGDGAMLDIGFQNLSRLLASGKPVRVVVLDTQVYSNTGGQACTSGFTGQVSDMAAWGRAQHGKTETRKELALLAIAHRNVFLVQSSQAAPSHLLGGVLRGLQSRYPAVFVLNCPCPPEHGLGDDAATDAARLALEARAFPLLVYDPAAGKHLADRLSLDGNPMVDEVWPTYDLRYTDNDGATQVLTLPVTIADWAATESRFRKHFKVVADDADPAALMRFDEYVAASPAEREGRIPFIHARDCDGHLVRLAASREIVELADDRVSLWQQLRHMAGLDVPPAIRERIAADVQATLGTEIAALEAAHAATVADLRTRYPAVVARRMAEGLVRATANGQETIADLLRRVQEMRNLEPLGKVDLGRGNGGGTAAPPPSPVVPAGAPAPAPAAAAGAASPAVAPPAAADDEGVGLEPYIDSELCTACNECTNLNKRLFAYNEKKQAYIKDASAGTFREIVMAAEKCPVGIIHPGTPLNPKEKDLEKWVKRAERFN